MRQYATWMIFAEKMKEGFTRGSGRPLFNAVND